MTEAEAKTKWCQETYRDDFINFETRCCIASACMAWRTTKEESYSLVVDQISESWEKEGWRIEIRDNKRIAVMGGIGYCGKAGKP